jgi:hypothetical protein
VSDAGMSQLQSSINVELDEKKFFLDVCLGGKNGAD